MTVSPDVPPLAAAGLADAVALIRMFTKRNLRIPPSTAIETRVRRSHQGTNL